MADQLRHRHHWVFCGAALAVWLALGWPSLQALMSGTMRRGFDVPVVWLVPYLLFGAALFGAAVLKPRASLQWSLLWVQLAAVLAMASIAPVATASALLIIIAWQVAVATTPRRALAWVAFQTLATVGTLALARAGLPPVILLSVTLQLCFVFTARALRREAETARALGEANAQLRSAQAIIASTARDAERLRISRELHDAWGDQLTALGLQLEIASNIGSRGAAIGHVTEAKGLAGALMARVREVVAALREAERGDVRGALEAREQPRSGRHSPTRGRGDRLDWIFGVGALAVWLVLGLPVLQTFMAGGTIRGAPVSALWLVPFTLFGAAVLAAMVLKPAPRLRWALLGVQFAAVVGMAIIVPWAMMSVFLAIVAWQVAMTTAPLKALGWVAFQTGAVTGALALAPKPDLCWVVGLSSGLQLLLVFAAQALRREAEAARILALANSELRSAQAIIASTARDAERLRISRELHDAWGHELTALGLQLEIASHVTDARRANDHVTQAKGLARALLAKVRDVVAALREAEGRDLTDALEALANSVPKPAIHLDIAPGVRVGPDQAHALMRCAQEAVTNAVRHSQADNLWLQVAPDAEGVRFVARNDGSARPVAAAPGSGLLGMRERLEQLGGRLAVGSGADFGFTVDAWVPLRNPQIA